MYPNYRPDRNSLGFKTVKDSNCCMKLLKSVDLTVSKLLKPLKFNKLKSKLNSKSIGFIILVFMFWLTSLDSEDKINSRPAVVKFQSNTKDSQGKIKINEYRKLPVYINTIDQESRKKVRTLNSDELKKLNKLRGGDFFVSALIMITVIFLWKFAQLDLQVNGFYGWGVQIQPHNNRLNYPSDTFSPSKTSESSLEINRPSAMPHNDFTRLTKQERRNLEHPNDGFIKREGYPPLRVGFNQMDFKLPDHGKVHDLPYILKANGLPKTPKTKENTLKLIDSIVNMPNRDGVILIEYNAMYQGGTARGFPAIHIYDPNKRVIAVFSKETLNIVTTCELSP